MTLPGGAIVHDHYREASNAIDPAATIAMGCGGPSLSVLCFRAAATKGVIIPSRVTMSQGRSDTRGAYDAGS